MKVSVSLPDEDIRFLDEYAQQQGISSRSAAVHRAVRLLQASGLGAAYEAAWNEWEASEDAPLWDSTIKDGL
ncbi:MAG: ribbon-helix-helix domain-containing protein [Candidatus Dormibacteria bacterium]